MVRNVIYCFTKNIHYVETVIFLSPPICNIPPFVTSPTFNVTLPTLLQIGTVGMSVIFKLMTGACLFRKSTKNVNWQ